MRRAVAAVAVLLLAGCADAAPNESSPDPSATVASGTPMPAPTPAPTYGSWDPGSPYEAIAILEAMRDSRRPGGVPDQLETEAIAARVASTIWTFDGQPWDTISIGGSCGPVRCTLEVGGTRFGANGEDLWILEVIPAAGEVAVIDTTLRSIPSHVGSLLDGVARTAEPGIEREGLVLASVRWHGPADEDAYELSYRSGDEEGSCELEILVETGRDEVTVRDTTGC